MAQALLLKLPNANGIQEVVGALDFTDTRRIVHMGDEGYLVCRVDEDQNAEKQDGQDGFHCGKSVKVQFDPSFENGNDIQDKFLLLCPRACSHNSRRVT